MPIIRSTAARRRYPRIRRATGWLLTVGAIGLWPACWIASVMLHSGICGFGLAAWICSESTVDFITHQALVSWSPGLSVLLFAVGDDLRRGR